MLIGGIQTLTLIDYPGAIAATIFTLGCNFRCRFCHNPELVLMKKDTASLKEEEVFEFLQSRKEFLDGVCITGGEPTIHKDLPEFIKKIKDLNLKVKLDTNGSNFTMLKDLIENKLIDYVAMDIKGPWEKYDKITNGKVDVSQIKKSAAYLLKNLVEYEFRSTILPSLHTKKDIIEIAQQIKGARKFYLQQFKPFAKMVDERFKSARPYKQKDLIKIKNKIKPWFEVCRIRENI
jgi:pyruvate formate lyase activating enzyme